MYMAPKFKHSSQVHPITYISKLTNDCLALIFRRLGNNDRRSCSLVCRRWLYVEYQGRQCLSLEANDNFIAFAPRVFSRFDSITRLVLRYPGYEIPSLDYDKVLNFISTECPYLKCLKLRGRYCQVGELGMTALAMKARHLKKFSCWNRVLGAEGMNALLLHSLSLEEISIKHGIKTGAELLDPGMAAFSLKSICLKDLNKDQHIQRFAPLITGSKNLRSLRLLRCEGNWDDVLDMIKNGENRSFEVYLDKLHLARYS